LSGQQVVTQTVPLLSFSGQLDAVIAVDVYAWELSALLQDALRDTFPQVSQSRVVPEVALVDRMGIAVASAPVPLTTTLLPVKSVSTVLFDAEKQLQANNSNFSFANIPIQGDVSLGVSSSGNTLSSVLVRRLDRQLDKWSLLVALPNDMYLASFVSGTTTATIAVLAVLLLNALYITPRLLRSYLSSSTHPVALWVLWLLCARERPSCDEGADVEAGKEVEMVAGSAEEKSGLVDSQSAESGDYSEPGDHRRRTSTVTSEFTFADAAKESLVWSPKGVTDRDFFRWVTFLHTFLPFLIVYYIFHGAAQTENDLMVADITRALASDAILTTSWLLVRPQLLAQFTLLSLQLMTLELPYQTTVVQNVAKTDGFFSSSTINFDVQSTYLGTASNSLGE
jgi:hypothetical protein